MKEISFEKIIIEKYKEGDKSAFSTIFSVYYTDLVMFAITILNTVNSKLKLLILATLFQLVAQSRTNCQTYLQKSGAANSAIKIMLIGNSITENNDPGYRGYLYQKLKNENYDIDFVGTKHSQPSKGGDPDHSG